VCLGNICRSPTAEAVMRRLVAEAGLAAHVEVDSAGTAGWHIGDAPDQRSVATAKARGVSIVHRGRQFTVADLDAFDMVLVMDDDNRANLLQSSRNAEHAPKVQYLRSFDPEAHGSTTIDDPFYSSDAEFVRCFNEIEASCRGLLATLRAERGW
jgi:protein-tyrosine phosphatase